MVSIDTFKRGLNNGIKTLLDLSKVMVPVYIVVQILVISGIMNIIAEFCAPFMEFFGLPGEASLSLIVGYFSGIYAFLGTVAAIKMTGVQITTLAIMVSIAHNLVNETAVVKKLGVSASASVAVRLFFSFFCGFLYHVLFS